LRPEVDSGGYDLALEFRGMTRHMQLKSSYRGGSGPQSSRMSRSRRAIARSILV
jgi:hypothetical protein